nr:hypothetical protein [Tanacetum cinerariifolium]
VGGGVVKGGGVVFGVVRSSLGEKPGGTIGVVYIVKGCRGWCRLIVTRMRETLVLLEIGDEDAIEKMAIYRWIHACHLMQNLLI